MLYYISKWTLFLSLTDKQLDRLSEFLSNLALLLVASLILPNLIGVDKLNMMELILGLISPLIVLYLSLFILKKTYD